MLFTKDAKIQIPFLFSLQGSAVDTFSDYWRCQDLVFCVINTVLHLPSAETICGLKTWQPGQRVWRWLIVCSDTVITLTHSSAKNAYSLSNSRFGAVTVKSSCHGEMYFFCKHSCRLNTHLPRHPFCRATCIVWGIYESGPLYVICGGPCYVSNVAFIKKKKIRGADTISSRCRLFAGGK